MSITIIVSFFIFVLRGRLIVYFALMLVDRRSIRICQAPRNIILSKFPVITFVGAKFLVEKFAVLSMEACFIDTINYDPEIHDVSQLSFSWGRDRDSRKGARENETISFSVFRLQTNAKRLFVKKFWKK
mmetsp:Transcript_12721/g.17147  ORF Transcript_12721/g.17147 Transcript_12721/m.17147 type:complete len:129 (+) Transcript_12721:373-759(+)